jgi:hypothetical protein
MKKMMNILFLSCYKATELIEKKLNFKLSVKERLQLKMHKMMCSACSLYEKQSALLEQGLSTKPDMEYSQEEIRKLKIIISEKLSDMN